MDEPALTAPPFTFDTVPVRDRHHGWTPARQHAFIAALAETGCVADACRTVGMTSQSAYRLRRHFDAQGFRVAWDAALDYAIRRLSDAVVDRAINGVPVPHYYKGEQVGEHRRYDERLAIFLLKMRDSSRYTEGASPVFARSVDELAAIRLARLMIAVEDPGAPFVLTPPDPPAPKKKRRRGQRGRGGRVRAGEGGAIPAAIPDVPPPS